MFILTDYIIWTLLTLEPVIESPLGFELILWEFDVGVIDLILVSLPSFVIETIG